jgi:amino acid transporter
MTSNRSVIEAGESPAHTELTDGDEHGDAIPSPEPTVARPRRIRPRPPVQPPLRADLSGSQPIRGRRPGDWYVRIVRQQSHDFDLAGPGHLVATDAAFVPRGPIGRRLQAVKRRVIGKPIPTALEHEERLTKVKALAVFSSDALSSVAYATEEIMKVLILAGIAALSLTLPVAFTIVVLLTIVVVSYRQTIRAYPSGGGSYIVAKDNLGQLPGLTAAASLLADYVLTVSVSVAAGVVALTSLEPALLPHKVALSIGAVTLITLANLRGVRESGTIFAAPTYAFIVIMFALIGYGLVRLATGGLSYTAPESAVPAEARATTLFLLMAAFAQGCTAMTGTEAISNGVSAFRKPESSNARATLAAMGVLLATMFLGLTFLAQRIGVRPAEESVLSQVGRTVFGQGPIWVALQIATAVILLLAANTAFADFPRLASILAQDGYVPRAFRSRGDRLAFSAGIVCLAALSAGLLVVFGGSLDHLIPLYAIGVFTSFSLSQTGMVVHWLKSREPNWQRSAVINGVGATATGIVTLVIAVTKFSHGAWLVMILIPLMVLGFQKIHGHYVRTTAELAADTQPAAVPQATTMVVPIAEINRVALRTLAYATSLSDDVIAVHVASDQADLDRMRAEWDDSNPGVDLVLIESPYRSVVVPLLHYLDEVAAQRPGATLTVILPEFVARRWWEHLLHNQTALRLKASLLLRPNTVVTSVPYHLERRAYREAGGP